MKRVAAYCRQSVSDDLEFNSLDAQRQAVGAYVESQPGWELLPTRYDDRGFSGSNADRPAFQQLLADIRAGKVDVVVVYKIDRLSRSIADFAATIRLFEDQGVAFVSTTQHFDTSGPTGRLMLNLLMSFSEFEREQIAERTRDKMAATRRRGGWTGGTPMLGYLVVDKRLVVDESEAEQVRQIFGLFKTLKAFGTVASELNRRQWTTKRHKGRGGRPFDKHSVRRILTSVLYLGKVEYRGETFDGDHEPIVAPDLWDTVQRILADTSQPRPRRTPRQAILGGLLRCAQCGAGFVHTYTAKAGRRYRYYECDTVRRRGATACPGSRVPAPKLESVVLDQIRSLGRDESIQRETLRVAQGLAESQKPPLDARVRRLRGNATRLASRRDALVDQIAGGSKSESLLEELHGTEHDLQTARERVAETEREITALEARQVDPDHLREVLTRFEPLWEAMTEKEKAELVALLISRVTFDGESGEIEIDFKPDGVQYLHAMERESA